MRDPRWLADSALLYLSRQRLSRTPPSHLPEVARRLWFAFETTFPNRALLLGEETLNIWSARLMSGEQFYINYSLNGEHYSMGPYHTRRFAMSHIEDVRRQPGVSNVYLGNKPPDDKSYRKRIPITKAMQGR
jgi:hypothetical protein